MTLETRLRNTGFPPSGGGGGSSNSGGLAGTGGYYILGSANASLPFSLVVQPGSSVSFNYTGSNLFISAITNAAGSFNSGGLAGTGFYFLVGSSAVGLPFSKILSADSAISIRTDSTRYLISATSDIPLNRIAGSTYFKLQEFLNLNASVGRISGGNITSSAMTVSVATGAGWIKANDSDVDPILFFDWGTSGVVSLSNNSVNFVGVKYNAGAPVVSTRTANVFDYDTEFPLGIAVVDSGTTYILNNPWITADNQTNIIERFESLALLSRDNRVSGLTLASAGTRNITVSAGTVLARMSEFGISAIDTTAAGSGTFDNYFRNGSGGWTRQAAKTQWDNSNYDDGTGTLHAISLLAYSSRWFYLMADSSLAMVYGQADFTSLATALNDSPPSSVPDRILYEGLLIGRIIAQQANNTPASTQSAFGTAFTAANVTTHANLAGLTANDHPQYWMSSNSGNYYIVGSSQASLLPNSKILTAGSSVIIRTDATSIYIDAQTGGGASSNSAGLAGTGSFYILNSGNSTLPNSLIIQPGTAVSLTSDSNSVYINSQIDKAMNYYLQAGSQQGLGYNRLYIAGMIDMNNLSSTQSYLAGTIRFAPVAVQRSCLVDQIRVRFQTTGIGSLLQLGIYTNSADNVLYPLNLVNSSAVITVNSNAGVFGYAPNFTLSSNTLYWFAVNLGTATANLYSVFPADWTPIFGYGTDMLEVRTHIFVVSQFSNGMPLSISTGGALSTLNCPAIAYRLSA